MISEVMKCCTKCDQALPATMFYKSKKGKNGLHSICKCCSSKLATDWKKTNKERNRISSLNYSTRHSVLGLCQHCSKLSLSKLTVCLSHWFERVSVTRLGTTKFANELQKLAERQQYRCIYTNDILIPGSNMSLDHIIPITRDKSLCASIDNVQWITKTVNRVKTNLTHNEFVSLCSIIHTRFGS